MCSTFVDDSLTVPSLVVLETVVLVTMVRLDTTFFITIDDELDSSLRILTS